MADEIEDTEMPSPIAAKIANNEIMTAVARVAMVLSLPILTIGGTITTNWLESKFTLQETRMESMRLVLTADTSNMTMRVNALENQIRDFQRVNERIVMLETRQAQDAKTFEAFQANASQKLDRIQDSVSSMATSIATLTAILQSLSDRDRRQGNPTIPQRSSVQ